MDPKVVGGYINRGLIYTKKKEAGRGFEDFKKALEMNSVACLSLLPTIYEIMAGLLEEIGIIIIPSSFLLFCGH